MPLDRKAILECAFAILNESGYEALTLRRIANGLGVQAPAIYWHFKNKQELLDEMGTQVMYEAATDAQLGTPVPSWESWAMNFGSGLRRTLLRSARGGRRVTFELPFNDIMEFAVALLAFSPARLKARDWSFDDRMACRIASFRQERRPSAQIRSNWDRRLSRSNLHGATCPKPPCSIGSIRRSHAP